MGKIQNIAKISLNRLLKKNMQWNFNIIFSGNEKIDICGLIPDTEEIVKNRIGFLDNMEVNRIVSKRVFH